MANENFTIEQYNTLCAAIAQGALLVEYGDKKVQYRSLSEMLQIKSLMEKALNIGNKGNGRKYLNFTKGFN